MIRAPKIKGLFNCPLASCNRAISYRLIKYYRIHGRYIRLSHSFYLGVQAVFSCTFVRFSALHSRLFSASLVSSPSLRYQITRFKGRTESGSLEGSSQDFQWSTRWGTLPKPETPQSAAPGPSLTPCLSSAIAAAPLGLAEMNQVRATPPPALLQTPLPTSCHPGSALFPPSPKRARN